MASATQNGISQNGKLDQGKTPDGAASDYRFPASRKVYTQGHLHPDVRVPHREISLSPTRDHLTGRWKTTRPCASMIPAGRTPIPTCASISGRDWPRCASPGYAGRRSCLHGSRSQLPAHRRPFRPEPAPAAQAQSPARERAGDADAAGAGGHYHAGNGIHRHARKPGARPLAVGRPAPRPVVRRGHSRSHHAGICPLRSGARAGDYPCQHQPPRMRTDGHRAQLPWSKSMPISATPPSRRPLKKKSKR